MVILREEEGETMMRRTVSLCIVTLFPCKYTMVLQANPLYWEYTLYIASSRISYFVCFLNFQIFNQLNFLDIEYCTVGQGLHINDLKPICSYTLFVYNICITSNSVTLVRPLSGLKPGTLCTHRQLTPTKHSYPSHQKTRSLCRAKGTTTSRSQSE